MFDRGAYVLDVDVNDGVHVNEKRQKNLERLWNQFSRDNERQHFEHNSGINFLVIRQEYWERALSQAQQDHARQQRIQRDVHGENQNTHEQIKVKVPPKPYEPTKEERQSHEATHCPFRAWCEVSVKAKSPDGKHTKQLGHAEHIPVIEFDCAFPTDTPGGPKISMMVATDSIHGSIFAVLQGEKVAGIM